MATVRTISTTPSTLTANDDVVIYTGTGNKVTFLTDATLIPPGQIIVLINQGANPLTVSTSNSQSINGQPSAVVGVGAANIMVTDGANWWIESGA